MHWKEEEEKEEVAKQPGGELGKERGRGETKEEAVAAAQRNSDEVGEELRPSLPLAAALCNLRVAVATNAEPRDGLLGDDKCCDNDIVVPSVVGGGTNA